MKGTCSFCKAKADGFTFQISESDLRHVCRQCFADFCVAALADVEGMNDRFSSLGKVAQDNNIEADWGSIAQRASYIFTKELEQWASMESVSEDDDIDDEDFE